MTDVRELLAKVRSGELSPAAGLERWRLRASGDPDAVAIVGMACRFPGADDLAGFWSLLASGGDAIVEVPADRWALAGFYDPDPAAPGRSYGRLGGFVRDLRRFDAGAFGLTPAEAALLDPQQRLFLEVGAAALDHAGRGLSTAQLPVGVFVGARMSSYSTELRAAAPADALGRMAILGHSQNYIAAWLSDRLDLRGPSLVVDTACSSSLVALHLACESLRRGECALALAGGVDLLLSPGFHLSLAAARVLSPSGRCRVFDRSADGYVPGEGAGAVVLRRLADALRDGDTIHAVVRGSAINNDGRTAGITTPNGAAQRAVIERALAAANLSPAAISYVEAHGTGTAIGDPIEVRALAEVFAGVSERGAVALGSVKSNIGHLHSAAGVASLLKVVLALGHGALPPTLHCHEPNPRFRFADSPFAPNLALRPWEPRGGPRRAGISAFGFGGTNCHVILEEAPPTSPRPAGSGSQALLVSASGPAALRGLADTLASGLRAGSLAAADVAFTLHAGRRPQAHRLAVAGADEAALAEAIEAALDGARPQAIAEVTRRRPPELVFMFPGQGAQEPGMARELYARFPTFRAAIDRCAAIVGDRLGAPLQDVIFTSSRADLVRTELAQPAMFAVEVALAELWQTLGLRPTAVIGHSLGEYAAACVAGVLSVADGLELLLARGRRMAALAEPGTMAAILAPLAEVSPRVAEAPDEVAIAAINGPANTVIAGRAQRVAQIVAHFGARGVACVPLRVSHAFHSPLLRPIVADFTAALARCSFGAPQLELISNVTGEPLRAAPDADYWLRHLLAPVRFADGVATLLAAGHRHFIEVGPGEVLSRQVAGLASPGAPCKFYRTWRAGRGDQDLAESVAQLFVEGFAVAPTASPGARRIALPCEPFVGEALPIAAAEYLRWRAQEADWRCGWRDELSAPPARAEAPLRAPLAIDRTTPLLADHVVLGGPVLAGAAQWLLALNAVPGAAALRRVTTVRPLQVGDEAREVDVVIDGDRFLVHSRAGAGPWVTHTTGELATPPPPPPPVELATVRARCARRCPGASLYATLAGRGLIYGPSFRAVEEVWVGEHEVLARLVSPRAGLGPGLLDGALQALGALVEAEGHVFLPFFLEALDVWQIPPARCHALATIEPMQDGAVLRCRAVIVDDDGAACAAIRPLWLKRASAEDLARAATGETRIVATPASAEDLARAAPGETRVVATAAPAGAEDLARAATGETRVIATVAPASAELPPMFAPVWRERTIEPPATPRPAGRWLVLAEPALAADLAQTLAGPGVEVVQVTAGEAFARTGAGFVVRPAAAEDWAALATALGPGPLAGIAHTWLMGQVKAEAHELERGVYTHAALARGLAEPLARGPGVLWLLSSAAQPASGVASEPARAAALGLARAWVREQRGWALCAVDLETDAAGPALAEHPRLHAGELAHRGGRWLVRTFEPLTLTGDPRSTAAGPTSVAVITGAAGALGPALALHLARRGWQRIALLSRRPPADTTLAALQAAGAAVAPISVDISDPAALTAALAGLRRTWGPISDVFHLAGTTDDGWLRERSPAAMARVLAPKLAAATLVAATADERARIVLFASLAGVRGNLRQADYAAGNAYLDGLARRAQADGRTVISIDWSLWGELGAGAGATLRAAAEREGVRPLATAAAMAALDQVLVSAPAQVVVGDLDPERVFAVPGLPRARPTATSRGAQLRALEATLTTEIAAVAGIPAHELDPERTLLELGLDSATLVQLVQKLELRSGLQLYPTLLFEHPTIAALAAHFAEAHPDAFAMGPSADDNRGTSPAQPAADNRGTSPVQPADQNHGTSPAQPAADNRGTSPAQPADQNRGTSPAQPADQNRGTSPAPPPGARTKDVAIIGMSGRFPGAASLATFWANLIAGVDSVDVAPKERWDHRAFDPDPRRPDTTYSKWGGFLADVDKFDPLFFQISPREAQVMDPQQRLFLEVAYEALEDGGYAGKALAGGNGGVFVGITYQNYLQEMLQAGAEFSGYASLGNTRAILPNRVSYFLDWHGPSLMVDTLCSSALVAIKTACDSLLRGDCPVALAGAVNVVNTTSYYKILARMATMSPRGKCRPFDASADGYVLGEGLGALLLKPLARALADGDVIHAVIRGGAVNHDGKSQSLTAPNPRAQARLYRAAWADAEVHPEQLGYIEAHGTGTQLGDPVEIAGLCEAMRAATDRRQFCAIGSVKSNLGHLEPAAGMAGLAKVVLSMQHGEIPPSLHCERPNPHIPFVTSPFVVADRRMAWPPGPKLAGVSSFGIGGANAHIVVAEAPARPASIDDRGPCLVALSARDPEALARVTQRLREYLDHALDVPLVDIAYTLAVGRGTFACRRALVAVDLLDLRAQLTAAFAPTPAPARPLTVSLASPNAAERALLEALGVAASDAGDVVIAAADLAPERLLATLGRLWMAGVPVALGELFAGRRRQRVPLPTYPFADQRYWFAANFGLTPETSPPAAEEEPVIAAAGMYAVAWETLARVPGPPLRFATGDTPLTGLAPRGLLDPTSQNLLLLRPSVAQVRDLLRTRLAERGAADTTVLVVTGGDHEAALIAGLLRSAVLESRLFGGPTLRQVDILDGDAADILALEASARGPAEVRWRAGQRLVRKLVPWSPEAESPLSLRGATVLVVGGARGVGARLAHWFASRGANLAILGEQPLPETGPGDRAAQEKRATLASLRALGVAVEYVAADVADAAAVAAALAHVRARLGPLAGVVVGAARLADAFLYRKTDAQWDAVLRPKVLGTQLLDRLTRDDPLRFFVVLASMTGVTGNPGQTDYGAANSWQDHFAAQRIGPGRTLAIDWSLWADTGHGVPPEVRAALHSRGLEPLAPAAAVAAFARLLTSRGPAQVVVADISAEGLAAVNAMFAADAGEPPRPAADAAATTSAATSEEREAVEALLRTLLAARLKLGPQQIDRGAPLSELGVDSFLITEIVDDLAQVYGEKIHPSTVLEHPTLAALAQHLAATKVRRTTAPAATTSAATTSAVVEPPPPAATTSTATASAVVEPPATESHTEPPPLPSPAPSPASVGQVQIAVVGMACRFPGAPTLEAYRVALEQGVSAIGPAPWARFGMAAPEDPSVCAVGGFLADEDALGFDARSFGIDDRSALLMDPQQRLFLEIAAETLEHAAVVGDAHTRTGVFVGARTSHYWSRFMDELTAVADQHQDLATQRAAVVGTLTNYIAAHVAKTFDLRGPSLTVETACSSSLVAAHLAAEAIASGQCERAIAGGVDLKLTGASQLLLSRMRALATDGKSRVFDAEASGFIPGEGAGAVLLERLDLAQARGATIYAVIVASACNNDGRTMGLTTPSLAGQLELLTAAWQGQDPSTLGYVEAHGTGTALGDPIEFKALATMLRRSTGRSGITGLGSVKSAIGHLDTAAGVAGLIKVVLSLWHRRLYPTLECNTPNPRFDIERSPLWIVDRAADFAAPAGGGPRRAAVSALGLGGTNAHLVLEEATLAPRPAPVRTPQIVALCAATDAALTTLATATALHLQRHEARPDDIAVSANLGRSHRHRARLAVVGETRHELAAALLARLDGGLRSPGRSTGPRIGFVFPGQGSPRYGAGQEIASSEPAFARALDAVDQAARRVASTPILDVILGRVTPQSTRQSHLAWVGIELAIAQCWQTYGVSPDLVVGHSLGEYAASAFAGALSVDAALGLVAERADLFDSLGERGAMIAVMAEAQVLTPLLPPDVVIAAFNGPGSTVLAGVTRSVDTLARELDRREIVWAKLRVSHAVHSPTLDPILPALTRCSERVATRAPAVPLWSTVTGERVTVLARDHWSRHARSPVQFAGVIRSLLPQVDLFVEMGPGIVNTRFIESQGGVCLPTLRKDVPERASLLETLARLYEAGAPIAWTEVSGPDHHARRIALPATPRERTRFWPVTTAAPRSRSLAPAPTRLSPMLDRCVSIADHRVIYEKTLLRGEMPVIGEHRVLGHTILPAVGYWEPMLAAAEHACARPVSALREIAIHRPLIVTELPHVLEIEVTWNDGDDRCEVTVHGRTQDDTPPALVQRQKHVTAVAVFGERQTPAAFDHDAIAARCPVEFARDATYTEHYMETSGVHYGRFFRTLTELRASPTEVLARLSVADLDGWRLHAGLLDGALQTWAAFRLQIEGDAASDVAFLPMFVEEVAFCAPLTRDIAAYSFLKTPLTAGMEIVQGEVQIADDRGRMAIVVRGLMLKRVPLRSLAARSPVWVQSWQRCELPVGVRPEGRWLVLGEDEPGAARALEAAGATAIRVTAGPRFSRRSPTSFRVNVESDTDLDQLLAQVMPLTGIVDTTAAVTTDEWDLDTAVTDFVAAPLAWLRAAHRHELRSFVWCFATTRACLVREGERPHPEPSLIAAVATVVRGEHPQIRAFSIDLEPNCAASAWLPWLAAPAADALAIRGAESYQRTLVPATLTPSRTLPVARGEVAIVTGGANGLGLVVTRWLLTRGIQVVAMGRSLRPAELPAAAIYVRGDVTVREDLQRLATVAAGLGRVAAIFHAAGVIRDVEPFASKTPSAVALVLAPKVHGLVRLQEQFPAVHLTTFSSIAAQTPELARGLGDYAIANAFLDALVIARRARGLPGVSLAWTHWSEAGRTAGDAMTRDALAEKGIGSLTTQEGLTWLQRALESDATAVVVMPRTGHEPKSPTLPATRHPTPSVPAAPAPAPRAAGTPALALERVTEVLVQQVAGALNVGASRVNLDKNFMELGIDSLALLGFAKALERELGIKLYPSVYFEHPTIRRLAEHIAGGSQPASETPVDHETDSGPVRLRSYHFHDRIIAWQWRVIGPLDHAVLERSLAYLLARHELLRVEIRYESEAMLLVPVEVPPGFPLVITSLTDRSPAEQAHELLRLGAAARHRSDRSRWPLFTMHVIDLGEHEHVVLGSITHAICDGWSLMVLGAELEVVHAAMQRGHSPALPPVPATIHRFAAWQQQQAQTAGQRAADDYWDEVFATPLPPQQFPADFARQDHRSSAVDIATHTLDGEETEQLRQAATRRGTTLYVLVLAALFRRLFLWTGVHDRIVGMPTAGRSGLPGIEGLLACVVNPLLVRLRLEPDDSFEAILARTQVGCQGALRHADYTCHRYRVPPVAFTFPQVAGQAPRAGAWQVEHVWNEIGVDDVDVIFLAALERDGDRDRISFRWTWPVELFKPDTIDRLGSLLCDDLRTLARGEALGRDDSEGSKPGVHPE